MDVLKDKFVVTKKDHRCFGCSKVFKIGTKMRCQVNVECGDFSSLYICGKCDEFLEENYKGEIFRESFALC